MSFNFSNLGDQEIADLLNNLRQEAIERGVEQRPATTNHQQQYPSINQIITNWDHSVLDKIRSSTSIGTIPTAEKLKLIDGMIQ